MICKLSIAYASLCFIHNNSLISGHFAEKNKTWTYMHFVGVFFYANVKRCLLCAFYSSDLCSKHFISCLLPASVHIHQLYISNAVQWLRFYSEIINCIHTANFNNNEKTLSYFDRRDIFTAYLYTHSMRYPTYRWNHRACENVLFAPI